MSSPTMPTIFNLLDANSFVSYNQNLAHSIGLNEAILYQALISRYNYYKQQKKLTTIPGDPDHQYFFALTLDITYYTSLTERQQRTAYKNLEEKGLIKTRLYGKPAKRFFAIIFDTNVLIRYLDEGEKITDEIKDKYENTAKRKNDQRKRRKGYYCELSPKEYPIDEPF